MNEFIYVFFLDGKVTPGILSGFRKKRYSALLFIRPDGAEEQRRLQLLYPDDMRSGLFFLLLTIILGLSPLEKGLDQKLRA